MMIDEQRRGVPGARPARLPAVQINDHHRGGGGQRTGNARGEAVQPLQRGRGP
jgi:hypothetical protein